MENKAINNGNGVSVDGRAGREKARIAHFKPDVDIFEGERDFVFIADMPGSSAENVQATYDNGKLRLFAEVKKREPEMAKALTREYAVADFQREFEIHEPLDVDRAQADYRDGVLTLRIPKAKASAKKIMVQQG
jgi:HSP20 family molecular chaperone IbpA